MAPAASPELLYLDVAAVRIQRYLARTPTLRGRRGASAALADATYCDSDDAPLLTQLKGRARPNHEAGDIDGVVSLIVEPGPEATEGGSGAASEEQAEAVAKEVLCFLRDRLPGAQFQAVWGCGASYLDAYRKVIKERVDHGPKREDIPAGTEFPPVVPCQHCRVAPACERRALDAEDRVYPICADCLMRHTHERAEGSTERSTEGKLAARMRVSQDAFPAEFDTLATYGTSGRNPKTRKGDGHLATVYIDGNSVGEFFSRIAKMPDGDKARASARLTEATFDALAEATDATCVSDDSDDIAIIPHLLGGDDILVTVPAAHGWAFTRHYLRLFQDKMASVGQLGDTAWDEEYPTASAGLVFGQCRKPFYTFVERAEECLGRAKQHVRGRESSIDFVDLSADGKDGSPRPDPVTLDDVEACRPALDRLRSLPAGARTKLAAQLREHPAGHLDARTSLRRLNREDAAAPFLPATQDDTHPPAISLLQALRIVRWWR